MRILNCICASLALIAVAAPAGAQTPEVTSGYTVFLRGVPAGREDVSVRSEAGATTITSQGRTLSGSGVLNRVEIRYAPDGTFERFDLEGTVNGDSLEIHTIVRDGSAVTEGRQQNTPISFTQTISPRAVAIANGVFAGFAALPRRLARVAPGFEFPVFLLPNAEIAARVAAIHDDRMQTGTELFDVRRYELILADKTGDVAVGLTASLDGVLLRVSIPSQSVDVVRNDLAGASARTNVFSNPGDQPVVIPAGGFSLGATLTLPAAAPDASARPGEATRLPAVVLVAGSRAADRDALVPGVPTMGQIAGALAEAGFVTVRYDRRGSGQSGGRAESAGLDDYAGDVRTVVRWLAGRKDVDARRIAVIGHGEGAWKALLAASKENRIAAVASLEGPGTTGAELVLEQQQAQLDRTKLSAAERESRIALQKRIHEAVLTGRGWDAIAPELRTQADTPWFQSLLAFDPARVVGGVDVPLLILHGELDREIPVAHAERLADYARKGDSPSVELVTVRGINHLLIPAFTGEISEYASLTDRIVSSDVTSALAAWLARAMPPRKR
jgi:pimeloyl-ACP methyl ester carboxylesterase